MEITFERFFVSQIQFSTDVDFLSTVMVLLFVNVEASKVKGQWQPYFVLFQRKIELFSKIFRQLLIATSDLIVNHAFLAVSSSRKRSS